MKINYLDENGSFTLFNFLFFLFSLFLSKSSTAPFSLCIPRSESFLGVFKKTLYQKTKMPISYGLCWVLHIWAILHMRRKPNPTQKGPIKILYDNKSAIVLIKNLMFHRRNKHISIKLH